MASCSTAGDSAVHLSAIGYVRWTERRDLACFIDLVASKRVNVEPLGRQALRGYRRMRRSPPAGTAARGIIGDQRTRQPTARAD
jgi:hypothetical protein